MTLRAASRRYWGLREDGVMTGEVLCAGRRTGFFRRDDYSGDKIRQMYRCCVATPGLWTRKSLGSIVVALGRG